jgi:hypothetical protein
MKLIAQEKFSWAHNGVQVEEFEAGTEIETEDEELIKVSTSEGWAIPADVEAPAVVETPAAVEAPATVETPAAVEAPAPTKRGRAAK